MAMRSGRTVAPAHIKAYRVFLASPGDVELERSIVRSFFEHWNISQGASLGVRLDVIDWEHHATAGLGRPQALITHQTLERFGESLLLGICIMRDRFGSSTGTHDSGTLEEFETLVNMAHESDDLEVKWFFRRRDRLDVPLDLDAAKMAIDQMAKVDAFKHRLIVERLALFKDYSDSAFASVLQADIGVWLNQPDRPWFRSSASSSQRTDVASAYRSHLRTALSILPVGSHVHTRLPRHPVEPIVSPLVVSDHEAKEIGPTALTKLCQAAHASGHPLRALIVGEPGSGKSTLLKITAARLAEDPALLPTIADVADLVESVDDLISRLAERYSSMLHSDATALETVFRDAAAEAQLVLLLDGLDELEPTYARLAIERLEWLTSINPNLSVVIAGRIDLGVVDEDYVRLRMNPLSASQQKVLLNELLGTARAQGVYSQIAASPGLRNLARWPLTLTLIAELAESTELPKDRIALYRSATSTFLDRLDHPPLPDWRLVADQALRLLSWHLQVSGSERWTGEHIAHELSMALARLDPDFRSRFLEFWPEGPSAFLAKVAEPSGLLGRFDGKDSPWRYLHRQFREYLAATHIQSAPPQDLTLTEGAGRWGETFAMASMLSGDPKGYLLQVESIEPQLAAHAVRYLDAVSPESALELLSSIGQWDGLDLLHLVTLWRANGHSRGDLVATLGSLAAPGVDERRLGSLLYVLESLGVGDHSETFARCGRPMPHGPGSAIQTWVRLQRGGDDGSDLWFGAYPVTRREYAVFTHGTGSSIVGPADALRPVSSVSWWEAYAFARWAGGRLPTSTEWVRACLGNATTRFYCGDSESSLSRAAWFIRNSMGSTHPVGQKEPNSNGLFDMHGNVVEWCEDPYFGGQGHVTSVEVDDLVGPRARHLKGGGWRSIAEFCDPHLSFGFDPSVINDDLGFRVVADLLAMEGRKEGTE